MRGRPGQSAAALWRFVVGPAPRAVRPCVAGSWLVLPAAVPSLDVFSRRGAAGAAIAGVAASSQAALLARIEDLKTVPNLAKFDALQGQMQIALAEPPVGERLKVLRALSQLAGLPGRPYTVNSLFVFFLEEYVAELGALRDGETVADRAWEVREVLRCFHSAGVGAERMNKVYQHVAQDFLEFEAAGALLPLKSAVELCHTMLATGLTSAGAIETLLRAAIREPLVHIADDAQELRLLKTIEILIRLDFLHTQERLPPELTEYLSVVRDLRFYDRELRRDTLLSYQLAFFLRKHGFPAKRQMLGPYPLKVCDPEERINFEPVEDREFRGSMPETPLARKIRHIEAIGWRTFQVRSSEWSELATYEAKAVHIRGILKDNQLLRL